jgi:multidrug efflux pump subunit AcrA (membrane-fusion protein)
VALLLVGGCDTNRDEGEEGRRRRGGQESEEPREGDETVPVRAERARVESIAWSLEASAPVEALHQIEVHPEVAGTIVAFDCEEGRRVEAGAHLVTLEDPALGRAAAEARFEFER